MKKSLMLCMALLLASGAAADLQEAVSEALAGEVRTDADKARDPNRKPGQTLQFFRFEQDMRVLELLPGGGWYTKILAPLLREDGELFVSIGTQNIESNLIGQPGFDKITVIQPDGEFKRVGRRGEGISFNAENMDLVLTFRNLHNFTEMGRHAVNESSFRALKSGGYYGVVDHTRRHMQADDNENGRRMDPVLMIKEAEAVGFKFVDWSDLHYRMDDELRYEVGRRTVTGNTDRFTLLFQKP